MDRRVTHHSQCRHPCYNLPGMMTVRTRCRHEVREARDDRNREENAGSWEGKQRFWTRKRSGFAWDEYGRITGMYAEFNRVMDSFLGRYVSNLTSSDCSSEAYEGHNEGFVVVMRHDRQTVLRILLHDGITTIQKGGSRPPSRITTAPASLLTIQVSTLMVQAERAACEPVVWASGSRPRGVRSILRKGWGRGGRSMGDAHDGSGTRWKGIGRCVVADDVAESGRVAGLRRSETYQYQCSIAFNR